MTIMVMTSILFTMTQFHGNAMCASCRLTFEMSHLYMNIFPAGQCMSNMSCQRLQHEAAVALALLTILLGVVGTVYIPHIGATLEATT